MKIKNKFYKVFMLFASLTLITGVGVLTTYKGLENNNTNLTTNSLTKELYNDPSDSSEENQENSNPVNSNANNNSDQNNGNEQETASNVFLFKPSVVNLNPSASWNSNLYPSQVTTDMIIKLLDFGKSPSNSTGSPLWNASGYFFEKINDSDTTPASGNIETPTGETIITNGNKQYFTAEKLKEQSGYQLGDVQRASLNSLVVEFEDQDDLNGELTFKLYQTMAAYEKHKDKTYNFYNKETNLTNIRSLIVPPTTYKASDENPNVWKLPSNYRMQKLKFTFNWNDENLIDNYIKNSNKLASESKDYSLLLNNFFTIGVNYLNSPQKFEMPRLAINTEHNNDLGTLTVNVNLTDKFVGGRRTVSKIFFGFRKNSNNVGTTTVLNLVNNSQLNQAVIQQPIWNSEGQNYVGKRVADLLPSQFFNVDPLKSYNYNFLDVFNGLKKSVGNSNLTALNITKSDGSSTGEIGYLTYLGRRSKEDILSVLPGFNIKKIEGFPDDTKGTLELLIYYESLSENGKLIDVPPQKVIFTNFLTNKDSGQTLLFAWNDNIPDEYVSYSAKEIIDLYEKARGQLVGRETFTNSSRAKGIISKFFTASEYVLKNKYETDYSISPEREGAGVQIALVPAGNDRDGNKLPDNFKIDIKFAQFNGVNDYVLSKTYVPAKNQITLPTALISSIAIKQEFLAKKHPYSDLLPTEITLNEIKQMFELKIPEGAAKYTSSLDETTIFHVPNNREGELIVAIIFPKFNNQEEYEFRANISNFKKDEVLSLDLGFNYVPTIDLSSDLLSRNPLDETSVNSEIILESLFKINNPIIFKNLKSSNIKIVERANGFVVVEVSINWKDLIDGNDANNKSTQDTSKKTNQNVSKTLYAENDNHTYKLKFKIDGFVGSEQNLQTSDNTPLFKKGVVSDSDVYIIAGSLSAAFVVLLIVFGVILLYRFRKYRIKREKVN